MNKVATGKNTGKKYYTWWGRAVCTLNGRDWENWGETSINRPKTIKWTIKYIHNTYICTSRQKRIEECTFISGNGCFFDEQLEMLKRIKCTIKNVVLFILHLPNGHVRFAGSDQTQSAIDSEEIFTIRQLIGHKRCVAIDILFAFFRHSNI